MQVAEDDELICSSSHDWPENTLWLWGMPLNPDAGCVRLSSLLQIHFSGFSGRNQSRCSPGYSVVRPWFRPTYAPFRGVIIRLFGGGAIQPAWAGHNWCEAWKSVSSSGLGDLED